MRKCIFFRTQLSSGYVPFVIWRTVVVNQRVSLQRGANDNKLQRFLSFLDTSVLTIFLVVWNSVLEYATLNSPTYLLQTPSPGRKQYLLDAFVIVILFDILSWLFLLLNNIIYTHNFPCGDLLSFTILLFIDCAL